MTGIDPAGKNLLFIVGSPRSGTSWLTRLIGGHPAAAAMQETQLLNRYCQPWYDAWNEQLPADAGQWSRHRHRGLPAVLTAEELDAHVVGLARDVYAKVLMLKPTAHIVVDKNPEYSVHVDVIRRMFPDAGVLHIVRDGRDVATSMIAASRGWGRDWAPTDVRLAARTWRINVTAASAAASSGRYLQVRYEDLLADGPRVLAECLSFAGVVTPAEECRDLVARFDKATPATQENDSLLWSGEVVKRLGAAPAEPEGFYGTGRAGSWRQQWSARQRLAFEVEAGALLRSLDYELDDDWIAVRPARRAAAVTSRRLAERAGGLGWRMHTALGRRGLYVHVARVAPYGKEG